MRDLLICSFKIGHIIETGMLYKALLLIHEKLNEEETWKTQRVLNRIRFSPES